MSAVEFRHVELAELVMCDLCDVGKRAIGCIRVVAHRHTSPAVFTICDTCAVEIGCIMIRAYFTPEARATQPPPEPDRSGGGI